VDLPINGQAEDEAWAVRINSKDKIGEEPISDARQMLHRHHSYTVSSVARFLNSSTERAIDFIEHLQAGDYIEPDPEVLFHNQEPTWLITSKGSRLALATAARPLLRSTAEKKVEEFINRIEEVRDNPRFLCKVVEAHIFGSYLLNVERLGDIDIAVKLVHKEKDPEKYRLQSWKRMNEVRLGGRELNIVEQHHWGQIEVERYLKKSRSRVSLHPIEDLLAMSTKSKLLYEDQT
jgi:hypothetical protein